MIGRYGNDNLNRFLTAISIVCLVLSFFGPRIFYLLAIAILVYVYFRMFSRNIYKRTMENNLYMRYEYKIKQYFATLKRDMNQRKTHHIYR